MPRRNGGNLKNEIYTKRIGTDLPVRHAGRKGCDPDGTAGCPAGGKRAADKSHRREHHRQAAGSAGVQLIYCRHESQVFGAARPVHP